MRQVVRRRQRRRRRPRRSRPTTGPAASSTARTRTIKGTIVPAGHRGRRSGPREPFPAAPIARQTAEEAYERVLAHAGASLPRRDAVDLRVIESVRTGRPTFKDGIIDSPADVGGWPEYATAPAPADADLDGMPDAWEARHGLDPNDPSDAKKDGDARRLHVASRNT